MLKINKSSFFLFSQSLSDEETDLIIEIPVIDLLVIDDLSHLAGVAAPPEINEDNHSVQEKHSADAEEHH
jgi:hypothetical protein